MILKEKYFSSPTDARLIAGEKAEKQMAFYLKREFGAAKDIWVINDLRIEHDGEAAQMDHVLVSQWGLFIVESKSITGRVHINPHGEWVREYDDRQEGMPSPVLQAEAQGRILKQLIRAHKGELLGTLAGMQKGFRYCPVMAYVAISDNGIIHRDMTLPQVMKADAVVPAVNAWLKEECSVVKGLLSLSLEPKPGEWVMTKHEAEKVAKFLVTRHIPLAASLQTTSVKTIKSTPIPPKISILQKGQICPECGQHQLVQKTISRGSDAKRKFLACEAYPKNCAAIYPLPGSSPAKSPKTMKADAAPTNTSTYKVGDSCPKCKDGKLVERKGKTLFLACSNFSKRPQCRFTDYGYKAQTS